MTTFVFLHGGGLGGWMWRGVADRLRERGHRALTPTFTGFGERVHLIGRDVGHDVHVTDIVNVLRFEEVEGAVLVPFSYGGSVAPGVAAAAPDRIVEIVYCDGIVPRSGESVVEAMGYMDHATASATLAAIGRGEAPIGSGVDEMQREVTRTKPYNLPLKRQEWLLSLTTDMPLRCTVSPVRIGAEEITLPVSYLGAPSDLMGPMQERARRLGWRVDLVGPEHDHTFPIGYPDLVVSRLLVR